MRKLLITLMTLLLVTFPVFAQESTTCSFSIKANGEVIVERNGVQENLEVKGSYEYSMSFDDPGDYYLRVWQVKGNDPKIVYDERVYDIKVFIVEEDGTLKSSVVLGLEGQEVKPTSVEFVNNVVDTPDDPEPKPPVDDTPKDTPPTVTPKPPINTGENTHLVEMTIAMFISLIALMIFIKKLDSKS